MATGLAAIPLFWPSRPGAPKLLTAARLLTASFILAALGVAELFLFAVMGWSFFGWINLAYMDLYLVLPLLAIAILSLAKRSKPTKSARRLAWLALLPVPILTYATFVEPFDLRLEQTTVITSAGADYEPIRIALLSDLQAPKVTDYEREAISRLMAEKPDLILISGDVIHETSFEGYAAAIPEFNELLGQLHAPGGVFMVQGNTDPGTVLTPLTAGTDVIVLRNFVVDLNIQGRLVALGGVDLGYAPRPPGLKVIDQLERSPASLKLLLSHVPDAGLVLQPNSPIDLTLAGHTHGGQVSIPFFGPPITLSQVPRHVAAGGLNAINGNPIYVSRGVGLERGNAPRLRFLVPPELSILTVQ